MLPPDKGVEGILFPLEYSCVPCYVVKGILDYLLLVRDGPVDHLGVEKGLVLPIEGSESRFDGMNDSFLDVRSSTVPELVDLGTRDIQGASIVIPTVLYPAICGYITKKAQGKVIFDVSDGDGAIRGAWANAVRVCSDIGSV